VSALACAGGPTVAVRIPEGSLLREASAAIGPLVAPSANRSGRVSATSADAVMAELSGRIELVADGGPSPIGLESTVVDVTGSPTLLRPGAIPAEALEAIVGPLASGPVAGSPSTSPPPLPLRSPGLLTSHYAPKARLRLDVPAADVLPDEAWLAFGSEPSAAAPFRTVRLSTERDLSEAARNLYAGLRALDRTGASVIAVSPIPRDGVGAAIADRLARAAAPREDPPLDD
ncbi:MAG: Sua5 family C-terminal domain-containing protein, partial [Pseudomonadota bacterium]